MNRLKHQMQQGRMVTAAWAELGSPDSCEIMVRHGWNTIIIDGEHGIGDLETWVHMSRAIERLGGEAVLRLPDGNDTTIKKALDRGFRSFIVPMINSAEEAQRVINSFYYPTRGTRGYAAAILRCSEWNTDPDYGKKTSHEDVFVMLQCEHVDSVAALEQICAIEGVGAIFMGPNDLANSAGHFENMSHPEALALFDRVEEVTKAAGVLMATIPSPGRGWRELEARGYQLVVGTTDVSMLYAGIAAAVAERDGQTSPERRASY